jgi:hypothetical protein
VYASIDRLALPSLFRTFDFPSPDTTTPQRDNTTVAPQALFMMNAALVLKSSRSMASHLLAEAGVDDAGRVREVYERALGRLPAAGDVDRALSFIAQVEKAMAEREADAARRHLFAWESFCKALLSTNEFIYVN